MLFLWTAVFLFRINFSKNYFKSIIKMSNSLNPDQCRRFVGTDLGPNCLRRLLVDYGKFIIPGNYRTEYCVYVQMHICKYM